jgi:hypothetical protein
VAQHAVEHDGVTMTERLISKEVCKSVAPLFSKRLIAVVFPREHFGQLHLFLVAKSIPGSSLGMSKMTARFFRISFIKGIGE